MASYYQNIRELIAVCAHEMRDRGYSKQRCERVLREWENIARWMSQENITTLTTEVGTRYCEETFGSSMFNGVGKPDRLRFRAARMLISYQSNGFFEFRSSSVAPKTFSGETGKLMDAYMLHLHHSGRLSASTLDEKNRHLIAFNAYMESEGITLAELKAETITAFYKQQDYTQFKKRMFSVVIRNFLGYVFDIGITPHDMSHIVMPVSKGQKQLPTTYTEEEIRRMIASVERGSEIGRRDYLVLLLAAEYGWRASDIINFSFDWVDWDNNSISFDQQKTGVPVRYPLLSSIGNAIVDYLKHGRPNTSAPEIIVSHDVAKRGEKLKAPTLHSIVTKYLRAANIDNWKQKKHGPHALRHSLATNLLKKNASLPMIASILGHQRTETTKIYISLDVDQLRKCSLPMPSLHTDVFEVAL